MPGHDQFGPHRGDDRLAADEQRVARRRVEDIGLEPDLHVHVGIEGKGNQGRAVDLVDIDDFLEIEIEARAGLGLDTGQIHPDLIRPVRAVGRDDGKALVAVKIRTQCGRNDGGALARALARERTVRSFRHRVGIHPEDPKQLGRSLERARIRRYTDGDLVVVGIVEQEEPGLVQAEPEVDGVVERDADPRALFDVKLEAGDAQIEGDIQHLVKDRRTEVDGAVEIALVQRTVRVEIGLNELDGRIARVEQLVELVVEKAGQQIDRGRHRPVRLGRLGGDAHLFQHVDAEIVEEGDRRSDGIAHDRQRDVREVVVEHRLHPVQDHVDPVQNRDGIVEEGEDVEIGEEVRDVGNRRKPQVEIAFDRVAVGKVDHIAREGPDGIGDESAQIDGAARGDQVGVIGQPVIVRVEETDIVLEREVDEDTHRHVKIDEVEERPSRIGGKIEEVRQVILADMGVAVDVVEAHVDMGRVRAALTGSQHRGTVDHADRQRPERQFQVQTVLGPGKEREAETRVLSVEEQARLADRLAFRQRLAGHAAAMGQPVGVKAKEPSRVRSAKLGHRKAHVMRAIGAGHAKDDGVLADRLREIGADQRDDTADHFGAHKLAGGQSPATDRGDGDFATVDVERVEGFVDRIGQTLRVGARGIGRDDHIAARAKAVAIKPEGDMEREGTVEVSETGVEREDRGFEITRIGGRRRLGQGRLGPEKRGHVIAQDDRAVRVRQGDRPRGRVEAEGHIRPYCGLKCGFDAAHQIAQCIGPVDVHVHRLGLSGRHILPADAQVVGPLGALHEVRHRAKAGEERILGSEVRRVE